MSYCDTVKLFSFILFCALAVEKLISFALTNGLPFGILSYIHINHTHWGMLYIKKRRNEYNYSSCEPNMLVTMIVLLEVNFSDRKCYDYFKSKNREIDTLF